MKTKITVLTTAILMGTAFTVNAYGANPPDPPAPYGSGPLTAPYYLAPNLFKSEKAAFAALEGAMQEAEAVIYQGGCAAAAGASGRTWDINTSVDQYGAGSVEVSSNGVPQFLLTVNEQPAPLPLSLGGTIFRVLGRTSNVLNGNRLPVYSGFGYYSKTGQMMTLGATFQVANVNQAIDFLKGSVIKDFYKVVPLVPRTKCGSNCGGGGNNPTGPVPIIYDWGLQSVSKNYVPQDKWWQRSWATRSDGLDGTTVFVKDRLFSAKNDGVCKITIAMTGSNDASFFDQTGTFTIKKVAP